MRGHRIIIAVLSAPAAAAVAFYLLWLTWVVFASAEPSAVFADRTAIIGLFRSWPVVVAAFVAAFALELVVGLPLLALFRRVGWLSLPAFLVGGCAPAVACYFFLRGTEASPELAVTMVLLLVPGCIGALVLGYVGGWLTSRLSGPA